MRKRFQLINVDVVILQKTVVRCPWIDKAWNTLRNQLKDSQKHRSLIQQQVARLPLDACWVFQTRKLPILSSTHLPPYFPTRCARSTQKLAGYFLEYARWINIWRHGNFSRLGFEDGEKTISGNFCRHYLSARAFVFFGSSLQYKGMAYPGYGYGGVSKELVRCLLCRTNQSLESGLHK